MVATHDMPLPEGSSTAEQVVFAVASSSFSILNASIPAWIVLLGIGLALWGALAILWAVVGASRNALKSR